MSQDWYLMSNKHLSGYEGQEFEKTYNVFDEILTQSPEAYDVLLNGSPYRLIVQSSPKYNDSQVKRNILFKRNEVLRGDMIFHDGKDWLVFDMPLFNSIYEQSTMILCTDTMDFTYETDGVIEDYDRFGNPIYSEEPQVVNESIKCSIFDVRDLDTEMSQKINLPEGYVILYTQYTDNNLIKLNSEFKMFDDVYRIRGINKSMLFEDYGVLEINAERTITNE